MSYDKYSQTKIETLQTYKTLSVGDIVDIRNSIVSGVYKIVALKKHTPDPHRELPEAIVNVDTFSDFIIIAHIIGPSGSKGAFNVEQLLDSCRLAAPLTALILFGKSK